MRRMVTQPRWKAREKRCVFKNDLDFNRLCRVDVTRQILPELRASCHKDFGFQGVVVASRFWLEDQSVRAGTRWFKSSVRFWEARPLTALKTNDKTSKLILQASRSQCSDAGIGNMWSLCALKEVQLHFAPVAGGVKRLVQAKIPWVTVIQFCGN